MLCGYGSTFKAYDLPTLLLFNKNINLKYNIMALLNCPECGKEYGSWGFFNKHMPSNTVFKCEDCGTQLIVPE